MLNFLGFFYSKKKFSSKALDKKFPEAKSGDFIGNVVCGKKNKRLVYMVKCDNIWSIIDVKVVEE